MSAREDGEHVQLVKRRCRWCGRTFKARKGEAKGRGCPECEPPMIAHADTTRAGVVKDG